MKKSGCVIIFILLIIIAITLVSFLLVSSNNTVREVDSRDLDNDTLKFSGGKQSNEFAIKTTSEAASEDNDVIDSTHYGSDTHFQTHQVQTEISPARYPTSPKQSLTVARILKYVNIDRIKKFMEEFTKFHSRYYKKYYGPGSANEWLLSGVQTALKNYTGEAIVFTMGSEVYPQKNIIARLEGADFKLKSEIVVLGAHQDSINYAGSSKISPGADDNASGSGVIFEILRAILESGVKLERSLEFHWYAAEEAGLLGSKTVSTGYRNLSRNVMAMLNLDVLGYVSDLGKIIGIYDDNVDDDLLKFTRMIADNYIDYKWKAANCGYPCSDHFSWQFQGYPAIFVAELEFNRYAHSEFDTMDKLNFEQIYEFSKLALAFAIELTKS